MAGFVARASWSTGVHDPITVRALCVDDTALVTVDVAGLHEDFCAAVARGTSLPAENVRVHATHTHSGPASMPGRLGDEVDPRWLTALETACIRAIDQALRDRRPARLSAGYASEVDVARNRRHPAEPVDRSLPVAQLIDAEGRTIAVLVSYACHPVVLGADNTLLTADYPGQVRRVLEENCPGAVVLFLTGCAGDANTGHAARASISLQADGSRTFEAAEAIGAAIAEAVLAARPQTRGGPVVAAVAQTELTIGIDPQRGDAADWRRRAADPAAGPATVAMLDCWSVWDRDLAGSVPSSWSAQVGLLAWGDVRIVTLPGEPFARTGLDIRSALDRDGGVTFVVGYTDGCPGYLPPASEYAHGGYEVIEAHRYYGMPGPFGQGSAEQLAAVAVDLAGSA